MELPTPLYQIIASYTFPYFDEESEILGYVDILKYFGLDTQVFCTQVLDKLAKLKQKYTYFTSQCDDPRNKFFHPSNVIGGYCLLDALSTGCVGPFDGYSEHLSTYAKYTQKVEDDIKFLVRNVPSSIHCIRPQLREACRKVPPLAIACMNPNIPLYIIELLLQKGADPDGTFKTVGAYPVKIIDGLRCAGVLKVRFNAIQELFAKYRRG